MKYSEKIENIEKYIILFLVLLANGSFAQKGFEAKKKNTAANHAVESQFENKTKREQLRSLPQAAPSHSLLSVKKLKVIKDTESGAIIYIENLSEMPAINKNARLLPKQVVSDFFVSHKKMLGLDSEKGTLELLNEDSDEAGNIHLKYQQKHKQVEIYGAEINVHQKNGWISSLNGRLYKLSDNFQVEPAFDASSAIERAYQDVAIESIVAKNQTNFFDNTDKADLKIYFHNNVPKLSYEIEIRPNILERWEYMIDALNGEILAKINHTCTLDGVFKAQAKDLNGVTREINITQIGSTYYLIDPTKAMFNQAKSSFPDEPEGVIWTIDARNSRISDEQMDLDHVKTSTGSGWSATSVSAHTNASICYDYYAKTFKRNSLNGQGGNIISVINITDEDGTGMDNAYWNGAFMGYGNGNKAFKPLAGGLDVAGHEMTHGVIENTARLEYRNQSGALNESFADIFGALIDRDDWKLGEDIVKNGSFPSGALRSLENPNQGGKNDPGYQPKTMAQYVFLRDTPSEDNGGVHINSGIPNYAFYLFATAQGMNREKAEQIYYQTLTKYLTRTSKFVDLRLGVIQAAKDLYGDGAEAAAARSAFDAVGIVDTGSSSTGGNNTPGSQTTEIPINTGAQFMIVYEPVGESLYNVNLGNNGNIEQLTNGIGCLRKPSVTDDGSAAYFVGKDNQIYGIDLSASSPKAQILSTSPDWANVAISKDGRLLAALTKNQDAKVFVFNLTTNKQISFDLYNPTYTQGVQTGEVLYADSFEWDYSGEYIFYDAFNRATSAFGGFEYWDVGVIRVWNAARNDFADGEIQKIFTDLEEGDNIGNPTFSKTNPEIMAFDYLDSNTDEISILGLNLATGDLKIIIENNEIGFPEYTVDDKFMTYNSQLSGVGEVLRIIPLNTDKISTSATSGQRFFDEGEDKWGVFYAKGTRKLPTKQAQVISFAPIADQNQGATVTLNATSNANLAVQYSLVSGDAALQGNKLTLGNTPGKITIQAFQVGNNEYASASQELSFCILPPKPSLTLNGNTAVASGAGLYQWYVNGNPVGGVTTSNTFNVNTFAGAYSVRAVTSDGCFSVASNSVATIALGFENTSRQLAYPNPVKDKLTLDIESNELSKVDIYDLKGVKVLSSTKRNIDMKTLPAGSYLLKIQYTKGEVITQKIIKE